jgi:hypothetical protein
MAVVRRPSRTTWVKRSNSVIGWPSLLDPVKLVRRGRRTICLTRYLGAEFVPERRARPRERFSNWSCRINLSFRPILEL